MANGYRAGRGSNSVHLRRYNERLVLQMLRRAGEASRADIARAAALTNAAVGAIIHDLEAVGLIETLGKRNDGNRGQPATLLRLAPRGAYGIGVRLDRTNIETALVDFTGQVLARRTRDMILPAPEEAIEIVAGDIRTLVDMVEPAHRERIAGVGLAQPFNLEAWLAELDLPPARFRLWQNVDFAGQLEQAIDLPVTVENDGTAAAIAELFHGLGRDENDFLYLFIGPAIGGGVVVGGDCLHGSRGNGGDVAVMPVGPSRLASAPRGGRGRDILIARASLKALDRHLAHAGVPAHGLAGLEAAVVRGEPPVDEWIDDCVDALAPAILSAVAILDVPLVVVDTDLGAPLLERLLPPLRTALAAQAAEARHPPRVMPGSFGLEAGAIGAATVPMFFSFAPRAAILTRTGADREVADHAAAQ